MWWVLLQVSLQTQIKFYGCTNNKETSKGSTTKTFTLPQTSRYFIFMFLYFLSVASARLGIDSNELADHSDVECQSGQSFTLTCWHLLIITNVISDMCIIRDQQYLTLEV